MHQIIKNILRNIFTKSLFKNSFVSLFIHENFTSSKNFYIKTMRSYLSIKKRFHKSLGKASTFTQIYVILQDFSDLILKLENISLAIYGSDTLISISSTYMCMQQKYLHGQLYSNEITYYIIRLSRNEDKSRVISKGMSHDFVLKVNLEESAQIFVI